MKQGRRAQKFILPHWWTSVMWRMPNWRQSTKNTKVELYAQATLWKMILDLMQYSLNKDHQRLKWQQQKSRISKPDCQVHRTSSWRSICLYPSKNGRCFKIIENSQIEMSRHLDSSTTTQNGLNHGPVWKILSFLLSGICTVIFFGRTIMGKAIWENPTEVLLGEGFQLEMLIRTPWKRVVLICVCGWHKNWLERNKTLIRCGKYSIKNLICENQHLSWIMYTWCVLKDNVK